MSWLDKIQDQLIITCGDGLPYSPNWINAKKTKEYNISTFDFIGVPGTLAKRSLPLGKQYDLELYFQGDDHLDVAANFEDSADNTNAWILEHPLYGSLTVHPFSLAFDNSLMNVSKITCVVIETITEKNPVTTIKALDAIPLKKIAVDKNFAQLDIRPIPVQLSELSYNNRRNFNLAVPIIKIPSEFEEYNHAFNIANSQINAAIADVSLPTDLIISFINKPALFSISLQTRLNTLGLQFANFRQNISAISDPNGKFIYEVVGGAVVSAMCAATTLFTDEDNNLNANNILSLNSQIINTYNQYLADLDSVQTLNGGNTNSFIPDAESLSSLNDLLNLTVSNLFEIALNSKQERIIYTNTDTNIILLTHMLYGLDQFDNNISELMAENNIGLSESLLIKKGRKILYYI